MPNPGASLTQEEKEYVINALGFMEIRAQMVKAYSQKLFYKNLQAKIAVL